MYIFFRVDPRLTFIRLCVQANLWCTSSRARKVIVGMTLGALTAQVINTLCKTQTDLDLIGSIYSVLSGIIMPAAILVINVVVAIQVRRAAIHAAANLGVQPHHQSTSSVPTIMLITTSLIYVVFNVMSVISYIIWRWLPFSNHSVESFVRYWFIVSSAVWKLIFAYNFYVYLITGKQFRSDLHKLLCRCLSSSSNAPSPAVVVAAAVDEAEVVRRDIADTAV